MSYKTALIFGGSGFVGRTIVQKLAAKQYNIRVAVRNSAGAQFLTSMGEVGQIISVHYDITSASNLRAIMQDADTIINTVGIIAESKSQTFNRVHAEGSKIIAQTAAMCEVKQLIHISAMGVDTASSSRYAKSKAAGEHMIKQYFPKASIIRPSLIFGPNDHFFNLFALMARISPILPLIGGGKTLFQPVYVGDVADSIVRIIDHTDYQAKTYELGGPDILSFKQLLELMTQVLKRRKFLMPLPFNLAALMAGFLELLPNPLLTRDQVVQLKNDCIVPTNALTIDDLGIVPQSLKTILPSYLKSYMKNC